MTVHRKSFRILGVISIVLGILAIALPFISSLAAAIYVGAVLLVAGISQGVHAIQTRDGGQTAVEFLLAALYLIGAVLLLINPLTGLVAITIVLAVFFLIEGAFQLGGAAAFKGAPNRGMLIFSGVISLVLAALIFSGLPGDALWIPGVFLGIDLVVNGVVALTMPGKLVDAAERTESGRPGVPLPGANL